MELLKRLWSATLAKVNNVFTSLRNDWDHYSFIALVVSIALLVGYKACSHRVNQKEFQAQSLLSQAARVFHPAQVRLGGNQTLGREDGIKDDPISVLEQPGLPYVPPEAEIIVTPKDSTKQLNQVINVKVIDTYGFTLEPGLSGYAAPLGIGLDLKWFYYEKVGTEIGFSKFWGLASGYSPTVSLSYRLDRFHALSNTELQVSFLPVGKFPVAAGLRLNFGL